MTFDELLLLREMFTGERNVSPLEDDDVEQTDYLYEENPDEEENDPEFADGED